MKRFLFVCFIQWLVIALTSCNSGNDKTNNSQSASDTIQEIKELNVKIDNSPRDAQLLNQRAELNLKYKRIDLALSDIGKALEIDSSQSMFYVTLSDIYFSTDKYSKSKEALEKAIRVNPKDQKALLKLAELFFYVKDYQQSFQYIKKLLDIDKLNPKAYFIQAFVYKEIGDTARAIKNFQIAVEQDQQYFDAYMQLGFLYGLKKNKLAEGYFERALSVNTQSIEALYAIAMYYQNNNVFEKAIEKYQAIIAIDSTYKYAYYNIGYVQYEKLKNYKIAVEYFSKAIRWSPDYVEAYFNRGLSYEKLGDVKKARLDYKKAIQLKPNYEKAVDALNRID